MVLNLKQKLEPLYFDEDKGTWKTNVTEFLSICYELSAYYEELTKKDQINKLIRSLPDSFAPPSFYISTNENASFEVVKNAVSTELERCANPNNNRHRHNGNNGNGEYKKESNYSDKGTRVHGRYRGAQLVRGFQRGRYTRSSDPGFHYCGKLGHFISVCGVRIAEEGSGRIQSEVAEVGTVEGSAATIETDTISLGMTSTPTITVISMMANAVQSLSSVHFGGCHEL